MPRPVAVVPHAHASCWPNLPPPELGPIPMVPIAAGRRTAWRLFDDLLAALGPEGGLEHFFLDGHLAALEDYSEVHPGAEQVVRRLASTGRLGLGPCRALMDEHSNSGETIVHNLQAGCRWATRLGQSPRVALLPPAWGHVPQLPQLLRQSGTDHVVITAGPWPAGPKGAFWWRSPDGSSVRAEYRQSHSWDDHRSAAGAGANGGTEAGLAGAGAGANGGTEAGLAGAAAALFDWLSDLEDTVAHEILVPGEELLWLHQAEFSGPAGNALTEQLRALANLVQMVNSGQDKYLFRVTAPQDYFDGVTREGWPSVTGELRPSPPAGAGEPTGWDGAFSGRLDLCAATVKAELALERLAEPLCCLWLAPDQWPEADFRLAWDQLVRHGGWRLEATRELTWHNPFAPGHYQTSSWAHMCAYAHVTAIADAAQGRALASAAGAFQVPATVVLNPSAQDRSGVVETCAGAGSGTGDELVQPLGNGRALTWAPLVPGYGWATLGTGRRTDGAGHPVRSVHSEFSELARPGLDNGLVHLSVNPADGSFAVNGHWGLGHMVDEADAGDVHTFQGAAAGDGGGEVGGQSPRSVQVQVTESGPCRGRLTIVRRYPWASLAGEVRTELELRAGADMVRVTTSFFNQRPGHRLRTVLALPARADCSVADCAFATAQRPTQPEATYPTKSFVGAGGLVVVHDSLGEYTVGADGWALAVTLLRSTSSAERGGPGPGTAGAFPAPPPAWDTSSQLGPWARAWPGPEQLGHHVVRYAVALGDPAQGPAGGLDPWRLADEAFVPLQVVQASGGGHLEEQGTHLRVEGGRVSAVRRHGDVLEVRAFNPSPEPVVISIRDRKGLLVDLQGNFVANWDGSFALAPWAIATVHIA